VLCFSRLKCVKIYTSIILYTVSHSKCLNKICYSVSKVQVIVVIPAVMVVKFAK
jgi:hypothetical protein